MQFDLLYPKLIKLNQFKEVNVDVNEIVPALHPKPRL